MGGEGAHTFNFASFTAFRFCMDTNISLSNCSSPNVKDTWDTELTLWPGHFPQWYAMHDAWTYLVS